ncbi:hypothetical protein JCM19239_5552 [Vibrio variabilis]|uniref:Uncharacterized protein n=1 Tax=Vibrio variabilis TaxID=990271 RepID=A0ABQ0JEM7_9VIBR|nr:hypothetical protein JCM19239_5552 [Vibrio variabilis]
MISRRQLLTAMASTPLVSMLGTGTAHALPDSDYKALVCVFLFGGNDGFNMLVRAITHTMMSTRPLVLLLLFRKHLYCLCH